MTEQTKPPFRFIRKWTERTRGYDGRAIETVHCEYEAGFWEGPTEPGERGRYVKVRCLDQVTDQGRLLNTAPSVSFYGQLAKAMGL